MGTNNLVTKSSGEVINSTDPNQYKEALVEDIVPRAASGTAVARAGDVGSNTYPFNAVYSDYFTRAGTVKTTGTVSLTDGESLLVSGLSVSFSAGNISTQHTYSIQMDVDGYVDLFMGHRDSTAPTGTATIGGNVFGSVTTFPTTAVAGAEDFDLGFFVRVAANYSPSAASSSTIFLPAGTHTLSIGTMLTAGTFSTLSDVFIGAKLSI